MRGLGELLWCRGTTPRVQHRLSCRTERRKVKGLQKSKMVSSRGIGAREKEGLREEWDFEGES